MGFLSKIEDPHNSILGTRQPRPINPAALGALSVAAALSAMNRAGKALEKAKASVPSYTAQWSDEDYYAEEQEAYNRAVEAFALELAKVATFGGLEVGIALSKSPPITPHQTYMSQKITDVLPDLTAKERKYCEGLIYVGDLVAKLDAAQRGFNNVITFKTMDVLRAIPPRWGLEDWVRPE